MEDILKFRFPEGQMWTVTSIYATSDNKLYEKSYQMLLDFDEGKIWILKNMNGVNP